MSDLFGEWIPDEWILKVFEFAKNAPQHTFQVLTKRPERMLDLCQKLAYRTPIPEENQIGFKAYLAGSPARPLSNVWLGVSIENQKALRDRSRYLYLLHKMGWITFYSVEPLLEKMHCLWLADEPVGWVICGGESGLNSRPVDPDWVRSIKDECQDRNIPFFFKQWGGSKKSRRTLDGKEYNKFPTRAIKISNH